MDDDFLEDSFDAEIDLTPLLDVVFLLLLFFILASTFSHPAMRIDLPAARTAERTEETPDRLGLALDADGRLWHRGEETEFGAIGELSARHPEGAVDLRVDRAAPFEAFRGAMDALREAGRNDVRIAAKPD